MAGDSHKGDMPVQHGLGSANNHEQSKENKQTGAANVKPSPPPNFGTSPSTRSQAHMRGHKSLSSHLLRRLLGSPCTLQISPSFFHATSRSI